MDDTDEAWCFGMEAAIRACERERLKNKRVGAHARALGADDCVRCLRERLNRERRRRFADAIDYDLPSKKEAVK